MTTAPAGRHLADLHGFAVLFPEQQRANNANLCFNWFVPEDIRRDSGEALSIRQMIEAMVVAHGLDRSRIFVTGLSAGGAMASAMLATYPEIFAGGAIIAGLAVRYRDHDPGGVRPHARPWRAVGPRRCKRCLRGASAIGAVADDLGLARHRRPDGEFLQRGPHRRAMARRSSFA